MITLVLWIVAVQRAVVNTLPLPVPHLPATLYLATPPMVVYILPWTAMIITFALMIAVILLLVLVYLFL
jgi:hypothetical protein